MKLRQPGALWRAWSRFDSDILIDATPDQIVVAMNSPPDRQGFGWTGKTYSPITEPCFEVQRSIRSSIRITGVFERRQDGCRLRLSAVTGGLDWALMALAATSLLVVTWILVVSATRVVAYDESWSRELSFIAAYGVVALGFLSLQPLFLRLELARFRAALERSLRVTNPHGSIT